MSEIDIMHQAAPTLAGIKAGSLFNCPYHDHQSLVEDCVRLNRIFSAQRNSVGSDTHSK